MAKEKKTKDKLHWSQSSWFIALFAVAVLLVVVVMVFGVGIYRFSWHGYAARTASRVIPFPAAIARNQVIFVNDILKETDGFFNYQEEHPELTQNRPLSRNEIQERVMQRYVQLAVLEDIANQNGVSVSKQEVEDEFETAKQDPDFDGLQSMLDMFGWDEDDLKDRVIRVYLLRQRTEERIGRDTLERELKNTENVTYFLRGE